MTFLRLNRWDWLAFVAALALLLAMSADWYTTKQGQECRRIERLQPTNPGPQSNAIGSDIRRSARECAERREKNAWQAPGAIDRLIAVVLLVGIVSAVAAAFFRAAGRRFEPPLTPSGVAAYAGLAGALLVLYRILQPPGLNSSAVVKWGAPVGLALAGILAIAARSAAAAEREAPAPEEGPEPEAAEAVEEEEQAPTVEETPVAQEEPEPDDEPESSAGGFTTGLGPA